MTDREKLLIDLLEESDRCIGNEVSLVDVVAMLEKLGVEHQLAVHQPRQVA